MTAAPPQSPVADGENHAVCKFMNSMGYYYSKVDGCYPVFENQNLDEHVSFEHAEHIVQAIRTKYISRAELRTILNHHTLESHRKLRRELGLGG